MRADTLSSHRPYICLNRHGVELVGFCYFVDILWVIFSIYLSCFARPIWSIFIAVNWMIAGAASAVLTGDVA